MGIGPQLKAARLAAGHTQESLAKAINVTKGSIGNYENEVSHPREEILYALIKELNIDANTLFGWPMKKEPPTPEGAEGRLAGKHLDLYNLVANLPEERKAEAIRYMEYLASQNEP